MNAVTFKCKTITPMFLAGADKERAELHTPSIKGAMHFWWRAMKGMDSIEDLKREESKIFGGTEKGEGKSKVTVRVTHEKIDRRNHLKNDYGLAWNYSDGNFEGEDAGIGYLLYSTVFRDRERGYIKDDFEFSVTLSSRDCDVDYLKEAIASFWILVYLGGLGTRLRRGGGNIVVTEEPQVPIDDELPDFVIKGNNSSEIAEWLKRNFQKCQKIICKDSPKDFATRYSNLTFSRFIISNEGKDSWQEALNDIGKKFKDFREEARKDPNNIFKAGAFGLPIRHKGMSVICRVDKENKDRRSSPLIIKTLKVNDSYYWLVLRLSGEFLPEGGVIYAPPNTKRPDYTLIDEFWGILKKEEGKESLLSRPKIIDKIKAQGDFSKIILFGSRARGDAHKRADIDVAVEDMAKAVNVNGPIDIVDINRAPDNLKQRILREGVEL